MAASPATHAPPSASDVSIAELRAMSLRALQGMFVPEKRLFVHHARRAGAGARYEGLSHRYTAMTLLGLVHEREADSRGVLAGLSADVVLDRLLADAPTMNNMGDLACIVWAALRWGREDARDAIERLSGLFRAASHYETVELSWAVTALSVAECGYEKLRDDTAGALMQAFEPRSDLYPHVSGVGGMRAHVACFADLVYPIVALSQFYRATGDGAALQQAERCAARMCAGVGPAGQWWWHHDVRTGAVLEPYPVYAVHQDAMAPMALFALASAGGSDHDEHVELGLDWLRSAPELEGASLIDPGHGLIWRKVARREPRKLTRRVQAAAASLHPALRLPWVDTLFPAGAIDWECRPYHLGWILYAWPRDRAEEWDAQRKGPA